MTGGVIVHTEDLQRGVRQLTRGVDRGATGVTRAAAAGCAAAIRGHVPRRTGRLAATVSAIPVSGGWGVSYGGGLSYARPVAARTGAVGRGIAGRPDRYGTAMRALAEREVNRL